MIFSTNTEVNEISLTNKTDTASITAVNQEDKTFTVSGDITGFLSMRSKVGVSGSTGNDANILQGYTILSYEESGGNTIITIEEEIPSSVADGDLIYYVGIDSNTKTFRVDGDQTTTFTNGDVIEVVREKNRASDILKAYTVDSSSYDAGSDTTSIVVDEEINDLHWFEEEKYTILYLSGSTTGYFLAKSVGTKDFSIIPQGNHMISREVVSTGDTPVELIKVTINNKNIEYKVSVEDLVLPNDADILSAINSIESIINP